MARTDDRAGDVGTLLRQLSLGLSTYRLFPGDLEQPAYVSATQRIRSAAEQTLADGSVFVEVHGDGFVGFPSQDETRARLALALFDRRAEALEVRGVPDEHDLASFYEALTLAAEEVADAGGVHAVLRRRGVTALVVHGVEPAPVESDLPRVSLTPEQRDLWNRLQDSQGFAADLLVGGLGGSPAEQASAVHRRFRALLSALPDELARHPDVFLLLHRVVGNLPRRVGGTLVGLLIGRIETDEVAQGYLGTMTDAELARAVVDLSESGERLNPIEVVRRLVDLADRSESVVDLTAALLAGADDGGTIVADVGERITSAADAARQVVTDTVADLLAQAVLVAEDEDVVAIREAFPLTVEDDWTLGLTALRDYLRVEQDQVRLAGVLETWAEETRGRVLEGDGRLVRRLLDALPAPTEPARSGLVGTYRASVVDSGVVAELAHDSELADLTDLLAPFGPPAEEAVLEHLGVEEDPAVRGQLVSLAAGLAQRAEVGTHEEHLEAVTRRLGDGRWFVVRNALVILQRLGDQRAFPQVATATQHPRPAVRRETVRTLPLLGGTQAVPYLVRLAQDADATVRSAALQALAALSDGAAAAGLADIARRGHDLAERRHALALLADHPAETAGGLLRDLASRRSRPRLPWRLRRVARKLARERGV